MIFHITPSVDWEACGTHHYQAASLQTEGFIHCSSEAQVLATARRYYAGRQDLLLVLISPDKLEANLVWENTVGGTEEFPHIYGPLNLSAVVRTEKLVWDGEAFRRE